MAEHDPQVTRADSLRGLDVLLLPQGEEDAAHDARDRRPVEGGEDRDDRPNAARPPDERRDRQQDDEDRQRQDEIGDAHDRVVDPAAVVAGDRADEQPEERRHHCHDEADLLRRANAVDDAAEVIAADLVGPEVVVPDARRRVQHVR